MDYDLEIDRVIREVRESKAKTVLLQFPDGLKPKATEIAKQIEKVTSADVMIWLGSNFGGCDIPQVKVDLVVNFGHARFK